jgi:methyl-accepting chemotaxis protein
MIKYFRRFYLNSTIKGKVNIAVIGSAGIILIVVMTAVLVYTKNIALEAAQKETVITSSENAGWACDYIDEKIGALQAATQCFESHTGMGGEKFDLYRKMVDNIVKDDTVMYAMWYIEDAGSKDSSRVQRYAAGPEVASNQNEILSLIEKQECYKNARQSGEMAISNPIDISGTWVVGITMPIKVDDVVVGAVGILLKSDLFDRIVDESVDRDDLACTIISNDGYIVASSDKQKIGQKMDEGELTEQDLESIKRSETFSYYAYSNFFKDQSFKAYTPIDFSVLKDKWSFCAIVPEHVIARVVNRLMLIILLLMALGLTCLVFTTNAIAKRFTRPVKMASEDLKLISQGRLDDTKEIVVNSKDEISVMVNGINELRSNLKHLAHFSHEIGTGNLEAIIEVRSEHDVISKAMVEMKQNLIVAKKAEEKRIYEDKIQDWKFEGAARIHEAIRKENTSIKQLCDAVLQEIIGYTKLIQGGLFVISDDQQGERYVELVSCVAYNRQKMMAKRMSLEEGMIGRCIYEKAPIILTEIPQDYLSITSGLGDRRPDFLAIIPLVNNDEVVGAIEVASFTQMEQHVLEYLGKAAESLASAIANVKINENTQKLLEQSKLFAEEMSSQEEELRQNMEEMQAAQEEMHRKTEEYEETIQSLKAQLGVN